MSGTLVRMPDGALVQMPDNPTPEQLAALSKITTAPTVAEDVRDSAVGGGIKGVFAPADMMHAASKGVKGAGAIPTLIGMLSDLTGYSDSPAPSKVMEDAGVIHKPTTGAGGYVKEGIAGGVGAGFMPGYWGPKLVSGVMGGLGGEGAANLFEDKPYARIIGSLVGNILGYPLLQGGKMAAATVGGKSSELPKMVSKASEGMTDADWKAAGTIHNDASRAGVKITPISAIEKPTPLLALQQKVMSSETAGPKMTSFVGDINPAAQRVAQALIDKISPAKDPRAATHEVQQAATESIQKARDLRTTAVDPLYKTTPAASGAAQLNIPGLAQRLEGNIDDATEAGQAIRSLAASVREAKTIDQVNTIYNEVNQGLSKKLLNNKSITDYTAGQVRERGLKLIDEFLGRSQVDRSGGKTIYTQVTDDVVNPLKRSLTGELAGVKGVVDEAVPPMQRVTTALSSDKIRAQTILDTQADLARVGKADAFPTLVRANWEKSLEGAFKGEAGVSAPNAPAQFAAQVWGSPEQTAKRENFRAAMAGVARSHGVAEAPVIKGAEKLMKILEAAGRGKEGAASATGGGIGGAVESVGMRAGTGMRPQLMVRLTSYIDDLIHGKAYRELADVLTSKDGMKTLRELASFNITQYRGSVASGAVPAAIQQAAPRGE